MLWKGRTTTTLTIAGWIGAALMIGSTLGAGWVTLQTFAPVPSPPLTAVEESLRRVQQALEEANGAMAPATSHDPLRTYLLQVWALATAGVLGLLLVVVGRVQVHKGLDSTEAGFEVFPTGVPPPRSPNTKEQEAYLAALKSVNVQPPR